MLFLNRAARVLLLGVGLLSTRCHASDADKDRQVLFSSQQTYGVSKQHTGIVVEFKPSHPGTNSPVWLIKRTGTGKTNLTSLYKREQFKRFLTPEPLKIGDLVYVPGHAIEAQITGMMWITKKMIVNVIYKNESGQVQTAAIQRAEIELVTIKRGSFVRETTGMKDVRGSSMYKVLKFSETRHGFEPKVFVEFPGGKVEIHVSDLRAVANPADALVKPKTYTTEENSAASTYINTNPEEWSNSMVQDWFKSIEHVDLSHQKLKWNTKQSIIAKLSLLEKLGWTGADLCQQTKKDFKTNGFKDKEQIIRLLEAQKESFLSTPARGRGRQFCGETGPGKPSHRRLSSSAARNRIRRQRRRLQFEHETQTQQRVESPGFHRIRRLRRRLKFEEETQTQQRAAGLRRIRQLRRRLEFEDGNH